MTNSRRARPHDAARAQVDAYGLEILDDADFAFLATLHHDEIDPVTCAVGYDSRRVFAGSCALPDGEGGPAVGAFELAVYYSRALPANLIGGATTKFTVQRCPEGLYADRSGGAVSCVPARRKRSGARETARSPCSSFDRVTSAPATIRVHIRSCPNPRACEAVSRQVTRVARADARPRSARLRARLVPRRRECVSCAS